MDQPSARASQARDYQLIVEKDVRIPLRDGGVVFADVFRPDCGERVPALMNISVYQKDKLWVPPQDLEEAANPYMNWETANPLWWCPRGYALVRVDARGSGKSPGKSEPSSYQESLDFYDAVEWIAQRPWCSAKVGTLGISYHAASQWRLANLNPPSLKAILPWEGRADQYRDQAYHGGIFSVGFMSNWYSRETGNQLLGRPRGYNPDAFNNNLLWEYMSHDLDSDWWRQVSAQWDRIRVPVFTAGNWSGYSLHLRGNTEAFMCAASEHKKLRIHAGTHFHSFHSEEGRMDQLRWFDHWLKGIDTGLLEEPPVKLLIRKGGKDNHAWRFENEWPLARTRWTKMYLKAEREPSEDPAAIEGSLTPERPGGAGTLTYEASVSHGLHGSHRLGVSFVTAPMEKDTEITGPVVLNLWISSTSEDADIFASLRNIGPDGKDVWEVGPHGNEAVLTKGWLRASHRKLDAKRSLPYRPYHSHDERWWLKAGEPVECQVEIWPTCIVLAKGHRLRLDVQPRDGAGSGPFYTHYYADYNIGARNTVHTGSDKASYLMLPVIPSK
jgi:putative CocE/NonD family hydrolase